LTVGGVREDVVCCLGPDEWVATFVPACPPPSMPP
jgi:hypothetical protein